LYGGGRDAWVEGLGRIVWSAIVQEGGNRAVHARGSSVAVG